MKKLLAILLSAILVLALSACVSNSGGSADKGADTQGGNKGASQSAELPQNTDPTQSEPAATSSANVPATKLSRDEAVEKALAKVGLKKTDIKDLEVSLDRDPDGLFWEVEFEVGKKEYDLDVNAETGEVFDNNAKPTPTENKLSRDEAIEKALSAAGLKKGDVRELEAELDLEHGGSFWEVEFESGKTEYSYDINASTGEIIKAERERD